MSKVVQDYYNNFAEEEKNRLSNAYCKIEFLNTLKIISKYFPSNGQILDIGAGPGVYSIELAQKGYDVTLFDLSQNLLDIAKVKMEQKGFFDNSYICDDARNIHQFDSNSFDGILLMGPLYHVISENDRQKILDNVYRILRPNGIAIIAYLNSWGVIRAGLNEFPDEYKNASFLKRYLSEFSRRVNDEGEEGFTDVYLTTPPIAENTLKEAGFNILSYAGAEGFVGGMSETIQCIYDNNPQVYNNVLDILPETCEMHPFRDTSEHLLFIVKKS